MDTYLISEKCFRINFPSNQFGNNRIVYLTRKKTGFFGHACSLTPVKAVYSGLAFLLSTKLTVCIEKGK